MEPVGGPSEEASPLEDLPEEVTLEEHARKDDLCRGHAGRGDPTENQPERLLLCSDWGWGGGQEEVTAEGLQATGTGSR